MTKHIHGTILTNYGVAANNRGENEGNVTTLQKILWKGATHSTVSAEAIRFALRCYWQKQFEDTGNPVFETNRLWDNDANDFRIQDQAFDPDKYIDDEVLGYMDAKAPKTENTEEKGTRKKGTATARRGSLEVTRAVSLSPFAGEVTFNAKSGQKGNTSLYSTEVHATSYQYSFTFIPSDLRNPERAKAILNGLVSLGEVGGNHARFLYDFSPSSVIYRVTEDPAPRILYVAEEQENELSLNALVRRVKSGDIRAKELIIGGEIADTIEAKELKELGVTVFDGVMQATDELIAQIL